MAANPKRWWALAVIAPPSSWSSWTPRSSASPCPTSSRTSASDQDNLSWVFNAYVIAFGGLLLLGGRLSDLLGAKRIFIAGWACWPPARSSPGSPTGVGIEIAGRAMQGAGAALIAPGALTLLMMLFGHEPRRNDQGARALRGGCPGRRHRRRVPRRRHHRVGQLAVGLLHQHPGRPDRARRRPAAHARRSAARRGTIDLAGAATATAGLALAVFGIVRAPETGLELGDHDRHACRRARAARGLRR